MWNVRSWVIAWMEHCLRHNALLFSYSWKSIFFLHGNLCCGYSLEALMFSNAYPQHIFFSWRKNPYEYPSYPGFSCSKLTMSLVNDSLKFTSSNTQICWNVLLKKMWVAFAVQKLLTFFQQKNFRILYIESAKTVNEITLNEFVKLTTLWTTGPRSMLAMTSPLHNMTQKRNKWFFKTIYQEIKFDRNSKWIEADYRK